MPEIAVIVNACGGSWVEGRTQIELEDAFRDQDARFFYSREPGKLIKILNDAIDTRPEKLVAVGGDGTIARVASMAIARGLSLGIVPLGTLNHFAKDLGIPPTVEEAAAVIAAGTTRRVDVGDVNGTTFVNNSSIGLYPRIVMSREIQQERLGRGKWYAALVASLRILRLYPSVRVLFRLDDRAHARTTPFVFVGNNEYEMDLYNIGRRERIDRGRLSVYIWRRTDRWGLVKIILRTVFGGLRNAEEFETFASDELTIEMKKRNVIVAHDGEVSPMATPLAYRILPLALTVIVPEAADA